MVISRPLAALIAVQSCTLLAADVGQPRYRADVAVPASSSLLRGVYCSCDELHGCAAPRASRRVATLRGGEGEGEEDGTGGAGSSMGMRGQSWADLVKGRSSSTNPHSEDGGTSHSASAPPAPGGADGEQIPIEMLLNMQVAAGRDGTEQAGTQRSESNIMPFMTDAEICEQAAKQQGPENRAGQDRELEPYECDDEPIDGRLEDDPEAELDHSTQRVKGFDQFKMNEEKFGIKTDDFNEDDYTAPINKQDPAFAEQAVRAERLAAEIEGSWASSKGGTAVMSEAHLRDERNLPLPDGLDEETLYSTVNPPRPNDPVARQLSVEAAAGPAAAAAAADASKLEAGASGLPQAPEAVEEEEMRSEELEGEWSSCMHTLLRRYRRAGGAPRTARAAARGAPGSDWLPWTCAARLHHAPREAAHAVCPGSACRLPAACLVPPLAGSCPRLLALHAGCAS